MSNDSAPELRFLPDKTPLSLDTKDFSLPNDIKVLCFPKTGLGGDILS